MCLTDFYCALLYIVSCCLAFKLHLGNLDLSKEIEVKAGDK